MDIRQLANVFFGASIGALVDLDLTDDEVIEFCRFCLERIRAAAANPEAMAGFEDAVRKL